MTEPERELMVLKPESFTTPYPGSVIITASVCHHQVWISESAMFQVQTRPTLETICERCCMNDDDLMSEIIAAGLSMHQGTYDDLVKVLGNDIVDRYVRDNNIKII